jgi:tetratricopeptide (TPR) repeat protein
MATHKNRGRDPFEETAYLELAKTYIKMGQLEDALAECKILAQHYKSLGMEKKAARVMALMARIDSSKAGPPKEITGLTPPMKVKAPEAANNGPEEAGIREASIDGKGKGAYFDLAAGLETVKSGGTRDQQPIGGGENLRKPTPISSTRSMDPDFDYNPGVERLEGGRIDDAVEQFQSAYEKKQNVFESSHPLGLGSKKKSQREGTHPPFAKASRVDGMSRDIILAAKFELGLILMEQGKTEEALDLLGEAITGRSGISQSQRSNQQADIKINGGRTTPAQFCCFTEFDRESQTEKSFGRSKNDQKKGKDRREYYCFYLLCSALLWILQNQFCFNN